MKAQRMMAMQPIVQLNKVDRIFVKPEYTEGVVLPKSMNGLNKETGKYDEHHVFLDLINIGKGPAIDVAVQWDFDFSKLEEHFRNRNIEEKHMDIVGENDNLRIKYANILLGARSTRSLGDTATDNLGHFPASESTSETLQFRIPRILYFSTTAFMKADRMINGLNDDTETFISFDCNMSISYRSIYDQAYTEKYRLDFEIGPVSSTSYSNEKGVRVVEESDEMGLRIVAEKLE